MTTLINVAMVAVSEETSSLATSVSLAPTELAMDAHEVSDRGELSSSPRLQSYHELGLPSGAVNAYRNGSHVIEMDVLEQLKSNMAQLEEMHSRLKFMMAEVRYLVIRE